MAAEQERILAEAWEGRDPDLPLSSPEELLILASIVEKETGVPEERAQVAGGLREPAARRGCGCRPTRR